MKGLSCCRFRWPRSFEKPYVYGDQIFIRQERETIIASGSDITELVSQRFAAGERWERSPALGVELADLDQDEILRFARRAEEGRRFKFTDPGNPLKLLEDLSLASDGMILNSAVVLFAKDPGRRYPQTRVRVARFRGPGLTEMADNRVLEGHLFTLHKQIDRFLDSHIPIRSSLDRGAVRGDAPAYPSGAVREGLLNALAHRDYASWSGGMTVAIYPDRLEIWNSGTLPDGIDVEHLKGLGRSRPQNPDIAHALFLAGLIERWGIGTRRVVSECLAAGLPEPEWKQEAGGISLTLRIRKSVEVELNPRQVALLGRLAPDEAIRSSEYATVAAVSPRQARNDLSKLTEAGYLRQEGKGPATVYVRTEQPYS